MFPRKSFKRKPGDMVKRFVSIWFRYLATDWLTIRQPELSRKAFVLGTPSHGQMIIAAANRLAEIEGIYTGMTVADARAIFPALQVVEDQHVLTDKLLNRLAEWCIRFTPSVAVNLPDGLILDVSGCAHLWGGDHPYLSTIIKRLNERGYQVRAAMADTIGSAWAVARFGQEIFVIDHGKHPEALLSLPPTALRLEEDTIVRLEKLGLRQISQFLSLPSTALRRRFGQSLVQRLKQAMGQEEEIISPVQLVEPYQERLPSMEPIVTATGIEIALKILLESLCSRLQQLEKGLRKAVFSCYRVDGKIEQVQIGTNQPSHSVKHLYKLFENKLNTIAPDLGIELFVLEAPQVEDHSPLQEKLWEGNGGLDDIRLWELTDNLSIKFGPKAIRRYLPDQHYWPERSIKVAASLDEKSTTNWKTDRPRPIQLLGIPERIEVTAPIPDYPPMLFRHKGQLHKVIKADGPERIEQEWWLQQGEHRDYYSVEDEEGCRYWLFRSGHYTSDRSYQWFIHGFFA